MRYRPVETQGDGACLFRAIAMSWCEVHGAGDARDLSTGERGHSAGLLLREAAVNQLAVEDVFVGSALRDVACGASSVEADLVPTLRGRPNPAREHLVFGERVRADHLSESGRGPGESFGRYARRMLRADAWGGEDMVVCLAAALRARIVVYRPGAGGRLARSEYGECGARLRVHYDGQSHYRALLREAKSPPPEGPVRRSPRKLGAGPRQRNISDFFSAQNPEGR